MDVLKIICDIIKNQLGLQNDQIWLYNQKVDIPNDGRMYVVVSVDNEDVFGSNIEKREVDTGEEADTWMNIKTNISINTFSYGNECLEKRYDIISAIRSVYSIQQQEKYNMQIARVPRIFMDASFATPTARLFSYHYEYSILHIEKRTHKVDYFDDFSRADMSDTNNLKIDK